MQTHLVYYIHLFTCRSPQFNKFMEHCNSYHKTQLNTLYDHNNIYVNPDFMPVSRPKLSKFDQFKLNFLRHFRYWDRAMCCPLWLAFYNQQRVFANKLCDGLCQSFITVGCCIILYFVPQFISPFIIWWKFENFFHLRTVMNNAVIDSYV